jgi:hypothetical protein
MVKADVKEFPATSFCAATPFLRRNLTFAETIGGCFAGTTRIALR